jgi:hypothetical protein
VAVLIKRLTNKAYGFPKGAPRRVTPVALVNIHITGNSRTAAYEDPRRAALDEWAYANRTDSDGPSATVYWARDGWGIDAIDNRYAAWSNGDVNDPNTANPGIRRVLALRARGYNANEAYWEEWENVGHPSGYRITDAQVQAMAERLRALSAAKGLPINRETVHGHWEINGVDRRLCPDGDHEGFLDRLISLASDDVPSIYLPVGGPGRFTIKAGTTARGWTSTENGWAVAKTLSPDSDTGAHYSAALQTKADSPPKSVLAVDSGYFKGLYVSTAEVVDETPDLPPAPPESIATYRLQIGDEVVAEGSKTLP